METCQSGRLYLFAKEAGCKRPREFESPRFRKFMLIEKDNIFNEVKALELPLGEYCVVGGGVLSAHSLRPHGDIDLLITKKLQAELEKRDWQKVQKRIDFEVLVFKNVEASTDMVTLENYKPNINEVIKKSDIINDIPFSNLLDVVDFKKALGREKDLTDIKLIKSFLK